MCLAPESAFRRILEDLRELRFAVRGEEAITAFTHSGVDNLTELVKMVKAAPDLLRRYSQVSEIDAVLTGC